jgi:hypothetical protein
VVDPYLEAIVRAVEDSQKPVQLSIVLTSGALVTGVLRHSRYFVDGSHHVFSERHLNANRKGSEAARHEAARSHAYEQVSTFDVDVDPSDAQTVTLSDVTVVWSNGDGVRLFVVRLNVDAIALWWIAPGEAFKGEKGSGAFIGVAIPIG